MKSAVSGWFNKEFPQNYIIRNPLKGMIISTLLSFLFMVIYKPLNVHESKSLNLLETMAVYSIIFGVTVFVLIHAIKRIKYFSDARKWNIKKEAFSILLILLCMGIVSYFVAFWLEPPADRWNIETFMNSIVSTFLIGIIPFAFFTILGFNQQIHQNRHKNVNRQELTPNDQLPEDKIQIQSQLKKEQLYFYPSQLLYAESDGNYVNFYIAHEGKSIKKVIRNSISNVEEQLSSFPFIIRIHRAFIVNLKNVAEKQGNASGYRLTFKESSDKIPVSRKNTKVFEAKYHQYHI